MALYIIADLHLSSRSADLNEAFRIFVDRMHHNDSLLIAGDLFEFYVGYDKKSQAQRAVKQVLSEASKRGINCYFQKGNRDFLLRADDARFFNMKLLPDCYVVPSPEGLCLIMHGDDLCTNDVKYLKFKRLVSIPVLQRIFMMLPLGLRKSIAILMRSKSITPENRSKKIHGVVCQTIKAFVSRYQVQNIIHGHIHHFSRHTSEIPDLKMRLVLGDWGSTYSYVRIDRNGIAMVQKPIDDLLKPKDTKAPGPGARP